MKRRYILKSTLITTLLLLAAQLTRVSAQSRAYLKFGPGGEAIGLFNLLKDPGACGEHWRVFEGVVTYARSEKRNKDLDYRFTLNAEGKLRSFAFSLSVDELPRSEIGKLIARKRGVRVRACVGAGVWNAEEVVRNE